jgi:hypothetical protein
MLKVEKMMNKEKITKTLITSGSSQEPSLINLPLLYPYQKIEKINNNDRKGKKEKRVKPTSPVSIFTVSTYTQVYKKEYASMPTSRIRATAT